MSGRPGYASGRAAPVKNKNGSSLAEAAGSRRLHVRVNRGGGGGPDDSAGREGNRRREIHWEDASRASRQTRPVHMVELEVIRCCDSGRAGDAVRPRWKRKSTTPAGCFSGDLRGLLHCGAFDHVPSRSTTSLTSRDASQASHYVPFPPNRNPRGLRHPLE